jgi:RNase P subunit RPR2
MKCIKCNKEFYAGEERCDICNDSDGYYIGRVCEGCGNHDRFSDYYKTKEAAQTDVKTGFKWRS